MVLSQIRVTWRSFNRLRRGIGLRLLASVFLFSSAITLILTLFQLYFDYRYDVGAIESRMSEIEGSYLQSLGEGLWNLDSRQLELQIEGILRLPAIRFVEVRETTDRANPIVVSGGRRQDHAAVSREFPLFHTSRGEQQRLGVLSIEATFDEVYRALLDKAIVILISQGATIFLVSFFILYITHRLVTRHLTALAGFLGKYNLRQPSSPLRLQRRAPKDKDELDQVVAAFEIMRQSLERAYNDLRESEQRFRDYAETASDWFWATGPEHDFTYFSEQVGFGFDWGKLIGKRRWDVAADFASEPENWREHMATLERREPFRDFVYKVRRVDDSLGFVSISGKPVLDAEGRFSGYRGVARDITERQRAEEERQKSEERTRLILDTALDAVVAMDADGMITGWNIQAERVFGWPREKAMGQRMSDMIIPAQYREPHERGLRRFLATGEGQVLNKRLEMTARHRDGGEFPVELTITPAKLGQTWTFSAFLRNITERKQAEARIRQHEAELRQLIEGIPQLIWRAQPDGSVDYHNQRLLAYHGCPMAAMRGFGFATIIHPEEREGVLQVWREAVSTGARYELECRLQGVDGRYRWFLMRGLPLRDAEGRIIQWYGTCTDIEDRKRAEEALREAQAELAHVTRVATLGELTASIAHEINQPLGAVVNNASACVRWLAAQNLEEARQSAARVIADGHRAAEIIRRIRTLAKKAPPQKDWLDLNATIRDVIALARSEVQRHGVAVETHLAGDMPRILADRIQVQQVLLNLLMNAIEAMSGVGAGPRELWVSSERVAATEVVIAVRDSGPGLEPQSLDRLFDAFYTTKPHGLGMGLAISRSIVAAHGGRLWATAHVPHGAVFQFTLPTGGEGAS
jgi:PAS domain S-box-containing protein